MSSPFSTPNSSGRSLASLERDSISSLTAASLGSFGEEGSGRLYSPLKRVAVIPFPATGHFNPMLALISSMAAKDIHVRLYSGAEAVAGAVHNAGLPHELVTVVPSPKPTFEESTKFFEATREEIARTKEADATSRELNDLFLFMLEAAMHALPPLLEDLREYKPDLILYDPMLIHPVIAARVLQIPAASLITYPGFSHLVFLAGAKNEKERRGLLRTYGECKTVQHYAKALRGLYGYDIHEAVPMANMISTGCNLCTGIADFNVPLPPSAKKIVGSSMEEQCVYVGPMVLRKGRFGGMPASTASGHAPAGTTPELDAEANAAVGIGLWADAHAHAHALDAPFPFALVRTAKEEQHRTIVYCSFGTVCTSQFWGNEPTKLSFGAKHKGKDFCRTLWARLFSALGGRPEYLVVVATVTQDAEALAGLDVPDNFVLRRFCPQIDVLDLADVFITHAGANSMMESIRAGVPMLAMPYFADQYDNATIIAREEIGLQFQDPLQEATERTIERSLVHLIAHWDRFNGQCQRLTAKLDAAGGADHAISAMELYVRFFAGHTPCVPDLNALAEISSACTAPYMSMGLHRTPSGCNHGKSGEHAYSIELEEAA